MHVCTIPQQKPTKTGHSEYVGERTKKTARRCVKQHVRVCVCVKCVRGTLCRRFFFFPGGHTDETLQIHAHGVNFCVDASFVFVVVLCPISADTGEQKTHEWVRSESKRRPAGGPVILSHGRMYPLCARHVIVQPHLEVALAACIRE